DWFEVAVEYVHRAGPEVGGVKILCAPGLRDGQALVDGATRRVVDRDERLREADRRTPAHDGPILGGEDEEARALRRPVADHEIVGFAVEDDPGGSAAAGGSRRGDLDHQGSGRPG